MAGTPIHKMLVSVASLVPERQCGTLTSRLRLLRETHP